MVSALKVPLVIAGRSSEPSEIADPVAQTLRAGARGVIVGRATSGNVTVAKAKPCSRRSPPVTGSPG